MLKKRKKWLSPTRQFLCHSFCTHALAAHCFFVLMSLFFSFEKQKIKELRQPTKQKPTP